MGSIARGPLVLSTPRKATRFPARRFKFDKELNEEAFNATYKKDANLLGRGGFGSVYSGIRIGDGMPVAIKTVEKKGVSVWHKTRKGAVPFEIVALTIMSDVPGVIKLLDWYRIDSIAMTTSYCIVMERPENSKDLFDFITEEGHLDEGRARFLFTQVVDTVIACSERAIVHRDIKDENIVINTRNGCLKLVDFGSSSRVNPPTKLFTKFAGTRLYAPPELHLNGKYDGIKSAVWSFGILLYDMVCGVPPYSEIQQIRNNAPLRFEVPVTPLCRDLVEQCLSYAPEERCSLKEIREHPWMHAERTPFQWPGALSLAPGAGNGPVTTTVPRKLVSRPRKAVARRVVRLHAAGSVAKLNAVTLGVKRAATGSIAELGVVSPGVKRKIVRPPAKLNVSLDVRPKPAAPSAKLKVSMDLKPKAIRPSAKLNVSMDAKPKGIRPSAKLNVSMDARPKAVRSPAKLKEHNGTVPTKSAEPMKLRPRNLRGICNRPGCRVCPACFH